MNRLFQNVSLFAVLVCVAAPFAHAGLYEDLKLSAEDQATIQSGGQVLRTEDVDGSVWPRVTVIQRIEAGVEQVAGVMFDYGMHKNIFEGIIRSDITEQKDARTADIAYTMTFPKVLGISLPNEDYLVTDRLSTYGSTGYEISWTMVRATSMKDTTGSIKFDSLGTGMIISYTNFINPPRPSLAKLIIKMAIDRVKDSVKALDKEVQKERNEAPADLQKRVARLQKALGR